MAKYKVDLDLDCPYCGAEVNHYGSLPIETSHCDECDKWFDVEFDLDVTNIQTTKREGENQFKVW